MTIFLKSFLDLYLTGCCIFRFKWGPRFLVGFIFFLLFSHFVLLYSVFLVNLNILCSNWTFLESFPWWDIYWNVALVELRSSVSGCERLEDSSVARSSAATYLQIMHNKSFLQARCEEPIMTSDWGIPLLLALLMLALLYTFLYLPATAQRALLEQALSTNNTTAVSSTGDMEDWLTDG